MAEEMLESNKSVWHQMTSAWFDQRPGAAVSINGQIPNYCLHLNNNTWYLIQNNNKTKMLNSNKFSVHFILSSVVSYLCIQDDDYND